MSYTPRLQEKYGAEVAPALQEKFGYKSKMQVPKITKIVISQGIGEAVADKKIALQLRVNKQLSVSLRRMYLTLS
jgi:large subunit ribosomal protein L5